MRQGVCYDDLVVFGSFLSGFGSFIEVYFR